jgi:hypothetical protein
VIQQRYLTLVKSVMNFGVTFIENNSTPSCSGCKRAWGAALLSYILEAKGESLEFSDYLREKKKPCQKSCEDDLNFFLRRHPVKLEDQGLSYVEIDGNYKSRVIIGLSI